MSSPIAKRDKSSFDKALISAHKQLSHSRRITLLADELARRIRALPPGPRAGRPLSVVDIGCGDMTLADALGEQLPGADFTCVDIHPLPEALAEHDPRWRRYRQFDGRHLPFAPEAFDVAVFVDVLHHVPPSMRQELLAGAARVARVVLIKDHFEYGWLSRQALRAMDFVGNFGYGVSVPERYFDAQSFAMLCSDSGVAIDSNDVGLQLYGHLPVVRSVLSPQWHFIARCSAARQPAGADARPG